MRTRVFGTESEYALYFRPEDPIAKTRNNEEFIKEYLKGISPFFADSLKARGWPAAGQFLGNGGRLYVDRGAHPEYATPECANILDLVAHEKAGDQIAREVVGDAAALLERARVSGRVRLFKNNADASGSTYGSHENYLVTPGALARISLLVPFLVTRQVFAGAGKSTDESDAQVCYQLTQRADFIQKVYSDRTTQVRGIINLRKREIPRHGENRRLHIVVGDANLAECAIALKIGVTSLVLRLLEEDELLHVPMPDSPVEAQKAISRSLHSTVPVDDGKRLYTALDIQWIYLEQVNRFLDNHEISAEEEQIIRLWSDTLHGLSKLKYSAREGLLEDDPADLKRRLDWVLKLWLLTRAGTSQGFEAHDPRLKLLDISYHDLDPSAGLFERCQTLGLVDRIVDDSDISLAKTLPPRDTRAWLRGAIIRRMAEKNASVHVENWEHIRIAANFDNTGGLHPFSRLRRRLSRLDIRMEDPLISEDPVVLGSVEEFLQTWGLSEDNAAGEP